MAVIELETVIHAPIDRCFDLARCIDLHTRSVEITHETAIAGVTSGLIGLGQTVTWRGKHLGLWHTHQSEIVGYERPTFFSDRMLAGRFKSFYHEHHFTGQGDVTLMRDVLKFEAPIPVLGRIAESLFLTSYLKHFLASRNSIIKRTAESDAWKDYLPK